MGRGRGRMGKEMKGMRRCSWFSFSSSSRFIFFLIFVYFFGFFSRELFVVFVVVVVVAFLFCDGGFIFSYPSHKLGRIFCCLVGWSVAVFSFFGDFAVFFLVLRFSYIHL